MQTGLDYTWSEIFFSFLDGARIALFEEGGLFFLLLLGGFAIYAWWQKHKTNRLNFIKIKKL